LDLPADTDANTRTGNECSSATSVAIRAMAAVGNLTARPFCAHWSQPDRRYARVTRSLALLVTGSTSLIFGGRV
jgi:hypothetical protein